MSPTSSGELFFYHLLQDLCQTILAVVFPDSASSISTQMCCYMIASVFTYGWMMTHQKDRILSTCFASIVCALRTFFAVVVVFGFVLFFGFFLFVCLFWDRVSLYSPDCPGTYFVDQAGLKLRNPPASASRVLGLKATMPDFCWTILLTTSFNFFM